MNLNLNRIMLAASLASICSMPSHSCGEVRLMAKDGTVLISRTMEFAQDLQSNLRTSPRGRVFKTTTPNNKPGITWQSKYGYVYVDGFGMDASFDGMNEAGLTFGYLYLPDAGQYQIIPEGKDSQAIPYSVFGDWVMSNFKTIDEVKDALKHVYVTKQIIPQLGNAILPAHASIYDASGKGIVVEFRDNKIDVYENIGVLTNSPFYDWHLTNLRNYLNLSPNNTQAVSKDGFTYNSVGMGSGAFGLPGDASPTSRFVKLSFMATNVYKVENAADLVNLGQHIINNFDLPSGYVRADDNGKTVTDTTQWAVFRDITNKMFYYRTYNDMTLRFVDLKKLDFSEKAPALKMPISGTPHITDVTDQFLKAVN